MAKNDLIRDIRWLGHSGIFIEGKPSIYINPYDLAFPTIGDLILITSDNEFVCAPDEVKWLRKGSTVLIVPVSCQNRFHGGDIYSAEPGKTFKVKNVTIEVLPAFLDEESFKNNQASGVGYFITYPSGKQIYYSGHTKFMNDLSIESIDVFIMPIGEKVSENINRLVKLINQVNARVTIPIDWRNSADIKNNFKEIIELTQSKIEIIKPKR